MAQSDKQAGSTAKETRVVGNASKETVVSGGRAPTRGKAIADFTGTIIADKYKVIDLLENRIEGVVRGGQSDLYLAEEISDGRQLVAKFYHASMLKDEGKQIKKLMKIRHDNLLEIVAFGVIGAHYYEIQPLALGGTLAQGALAKKKPCPLDTLRLVAKAAADGLEALHGNRIIHGDIKPSNIFWLDAERTRAVLADYGIASILSEEYSKVSRVNSMTDGFAAPELYTNCIYPASDYFSLGITLLELAVGRSPFEGINPHAIQLQVTSKTIPLPEDLDGNLRNLIEGLLRKESDVRYGCKEVRAWAAGKTVAPPAVTPGKAALGDMREQSFVVPFQFGAKNAATIRELLGLMREDLALAAKYLRRGSIPAWLRSEAMREPAMIPLADRLQDVVENETDDETLVFRAIYALDDKPRFLGKFETPEQVAEYIDGHREEFIKALF